MLLVGFASMCQEQAMRKLLISKLRAVKLSGEAAVIRPVLQEDRKSVV